MHLHHDLVHAAELVGRFAARAGEEQEPNGDSDRRGQEPCDAGVAIEPPTWVRRAVGRPHGPRRAVLLVAADATDPAATGNALAALNALAANVLRLHGCANQVRERMSTAGSRRSARRRMTGASWLMRSASPQSAIAWA